VSFAVVVHFRHENTGCQGLWEPGCLRQCLNMFRLPDKSQKVLYLITFCHPDCKLPDGRSTPRQN